MREIILCDDGNVEQTAKIAKERGFGIEVQAFHDPDNLKPTAFEDHQNALKGIALTSLHGPFGDLNPGSSDNKIREVTKERLEEGYIAAVRLGIKNVVFHNGYIPGTRQMKRWLPESIKFWQEFAKSKPETRFHIENMLEHSPELLGELMDGIGLPNVDICMDIGHAHCNSKQSVVAWIKYLRGKIGYVHIHDNHGETDEHLGLGEGTIPLIEVFDALDEYAPNAIFAVEAEGNGLIKSADWLEKRIK